MSDSWVRLDEPQVDRVPPGYAWVRVDDVQAILNTGNHGSRILLRGGGEVPIYGRTVEQIRLAFGIDDGGIED
jgi:hypothetical protein